MLSTTVLLAPGLVLSCVLLVRSGSSQYSLAGIEGSTNSGLLRVDIVFNATEDCSCGLVTMCRASLLTVSSNFAASFAVPHVKNTSSSPDMGAVNFVVGPLRLPVPPAARCFLFARFPVALSVFKH